MTVINFSISWICHLWIDMNNIIYIPISKFPKKYFREQNDENVIKMKL